MARPMTSRERVLSTLARKGYDRIPIKHYGTPEVDDVLKKHFGAKDDEGLLRAVGDDTRYAEARYIGPELKKFPDGSWEGLWGERYNNISFGQGTYPESVYQPYAELTDVKQLSRFRHPSADWYDYSGLEATCKSLRRYTVLFGGPGNLDFINGIARCRGVEQVLLDIATEDPVYLELVERRLQFFYDVHERALQAAKGGIDIVHCGEDLGTQNGILMSPAKFDRLFAPKFGKYFDMAHRYGAKVMLHSCGSVRGLLPRLIELGLDIFDVVQVAAAGMELAGLQRDFGKHLCFCGTMCVQTILPFGTTEEVRREVEMRLRLFDKGGLILGPTHALQVGTPLENILEMYRAAGSLAA